MQKRVLAFTLAIILSHTGFANADQFECQEAIGRYSRATKEISEYLRIIPIAFGVVAVGMIARANLAPSKMLNTTLKKQFLDIARSADRG
jgi:hypothetical protein